MSQTWERLSVIVMTAEEAMADAPATSHGPRRGLIFVHVPKTAGTTLNRIIEAQYNPLHIYTIPGSHRVWSIERFKRLPESRRAKVQVLKGHMGFGLHRYLPGRPTHLTMLREPVSQVVSSYFYAISSRTHPLHHVLIDQKISLEQFPDLAPWGNNLQTKLLGGLAMGEVNPKGALAAARRGEFVPHDQFVGIHCDADLLATAKRNLRESFSVVGLTERFEESLAWMMIVYGWKVPYYQRFRKSSKRPEQQSLDRRIQRKIEEANAYDLELYAYGQELFEAAMARHRDTIHEIRLAFQNAAQPRALQSRFRAGISWSRGLTSIIRSAL